MGAQDIGRAFPGVDDAIVFYERSNHGCCGFVLGFDEFVARAGGLPAQGIGQTFGLLAEDAPVMSKPVTAGL